MAALTRRPSPAVGRPATSMSVRGGTGTWETRGCSGRMSRGSESPTSSSCSFSPSRRPVYSMRTGVPDCSSSWRGDVGDPDRLAHLEDERLAGLADRTGLDDQLARLLDRHEVAGDVGVGDGERAAVVDLLRERREDRAA